MGLLDSLYALRGRLKGAELNALQSVLEGGGEQKRLADLKPLLGKFDPATAKQVGTAAISSDPAVRQLGFQQLSGLLGQLDPQYQGQLAQQKQALEAGTLGLQSQRFQNLLGAIQEKRAAAREPLTLLGQRLGIQQQRQQLEAGAVALNKARLEAAAPQPVLPYGKPPEGRFPAMAPSGQVEYIPQPGTDPFYAAQDANRETADMLKDVQLFQTTVEKVGPSGTELTGPAAGVLKFQRGNIISRLAKLRTLGVLQPGEYEILSEQLPDPTSWTKNVGAWFGAIDPTGTVWDYQRATIQEPYNAFRQLLEDRLRNQRQKYWYVDPVLGALPEDAASGATGRY